MQWIYIFQCHICMILFLYSFNLINLRFYLLHIFVFVYYVIYIALFFIVFSTYHFYQCPCFCMTLGGFYISPLYIILLNKVFAFNFFSTFDQCPLLLFGSYIIRMHWFYSFHHLYFILIILWVKMYTSLYFIMKILLLLLLLINVLFLYIMGIFCDGYI